MGSYQEARIKLRNTQLNKIKSAAKNKTEVIIRLNKKKLWRWKIATWMISKNQDKQLK